jgi:uncharacterized protein
MNVILKTVERCNINCSYCYFFNGTDSSFERHASVIARETIEAVATFLARGVEQLRIDSLAIAFHGGEPTLQRKSDFDWMCTHLRAALSSKVDLRFGIQTNGIAVDDDWIELFARHAVGVGVSIDGPRHVHDRFRVDHAGRGSYERTAIGIRRLQDAVKAGRLSQPIGALAVIDPQTNAREVFDHLVDELGFRVLHWELPDKNFEMAPVNAMAYGQYLCQLFDAWAVRDDPGIFIRIFASFLVKLSGLATPLFPSNGDWMMRNSQLREITISSSGDIGADDGLRQTGYWQTLPSATVRDSSLERFVMDSSVTELAATRTRVPQACSGCLWEHACGGGSMVNRWSKARGFDNPSVYCDGLKVFFGNVVAYLVAHGVPWTMIKRSLSGAAILDSACSCAESSPAQDVTPMTPISACAS